MITDMMTVLGIVLFFLGILVSIAWHELGHFVTARWFGIKVPEFMVGFGRTIWSRQGRRDRVRAQGHPARRLHPHDRDDPAGQGRDARPQPAHRAVPGPDRRRPAAVGDGRAARGRAPAVLPARAVEAHRRDVRRPVHEPDPGRGPVRDRADGHRGADRLHDHGQRGQRLRGAGLGDQPASARPGRRSPRPPRPASGPATGSSRSTGSRSASATGRACRRPSGPRPAPSRSPSSATASGST